MAKEKPFNGGNWTASRKRSFIYSTLRSGRWPVKYQCIKDAERGKMINPETGRKRKVHLCSDCGELFPQNGIVADHINPIVPVTGFDTWDGLIERLFCEIDGYQALCKECHQKKTNIENKKREEARNV